MELKINLLGLVRNTEFKIRADFPISIFRVFGEFGYLAAPSLLPHRFKPLPLTWTMMVASYLLPLLLCSLQTMLNTHWSDLVQMSQILSLFQSAYLQSFDNYPSACLEHPLTQQHSWILLSFSLQSKFQIPLCQHLMIPFLHFFGSLTLNIIQHSIGQPIQLAYITSILYILFSFIVCLPSSV